MGGGCTLRRARCRCRGEKGTGSRSSARGGGCVEDHDEGEVERWQPASPDSELDAGAEGGRPRLLHKDALELSVQLALTLLEDARAREALQVIRQAHRRAKLEWLPRATCDELQTSFALYTLVAAVAASSDADSSSPLPCSPQEAAAQVLAEAEAVFGRKAAEAVVAQGAPSALQREVVAVCAKIPDGEGVAEAVWRAVCDAAASRWAVRMRMGTASPGVAGADAAAARAEGCAVAGEEGLLTTALPVGNSAGFTKEWEQEMLGYGYTKADLMKMQAGEWVEG